MSQEPNYRLKLQAVARVDAWNREWGEGTEVWYVHDDGTLELGLLRGPAIVEGGFVAAAPVTIAKGTQLSVLSRLVPVNAKET